MADPAPQLPREERIAALWRRGRLGWKLYPAQREIYEALSAFLDDPATRFESYYVDKARQFGGTFIGLLVATERAIRNEAWRILYTAATRTGLWQFVQPNMETLLVDCPEDLRPQWNTTENSYHFPSGSQLHLVGVNNGHENDARGPKADLVINEEAAFVDRLDYLVTSVEMPMLTTTGGRMVFVTTRPETPAHEVTRFRVACQVKGNYIKRTIDDATHLSQVARQKITEESGGRDSSTFRRERLCEDVVDEARAIIPEYTAEADAEIARDPAPPPTYEQPIVAMDVGFADQHAVLFGYYDFRRAKLVIQAEAILCRARTDQIADSIRAMELALWGDEARKAQGLHPTRPPLRWSDTDLRLIEDLAVLHRLPFFPTAKDDKEAQVNALRMRTKGRGLHIDPGCKALRRQLMVGIWNKARTEFERTRDDGHFDAVDAAIYLLRNAPVYENPYPALPEGVSYATHHIRIRDPEKSAAGRAVETLFGRRN